MNPPVQLRLYTGRFKYSSALAFAGESLIVQAPEKAVSGITRGRARGR